MRYYELCDNSSYEKTWTFAVSIEPTSHVVDWHCDECGRSEWYPAASFAVTVEGGSAFPDFLGCGEYPLLIVSARVVRALRESEIECLHTARVAVAGSLDSRVVLAEAPEYYRLEITGECRVDFAESAMMIERVCPRCGLFSTQPGLDRRFRIIEGSWDGSDLFRDCRHFPRVTFCTQKVVDLARSHGLTNVRFDRMG
jgi:hypothetical protein